MNRFLSGLLACLMLSTTTASSFDEKRSNLSAEEIIARHLAAAGGKEKLLKFRSRIAIGTVKKENEPEGKMAIMSELPNRFSAVFLFSNLDVRFIFDGSKATMRPQLPRSLAAFDAKYREITASGFMFNGISLYNLVLEPPGAVKFEAKGVKKVRGRDAYLVEAKPLKGNAVRLYFDAVDFMWVRTDFGKSHISREMRPFSNDPINHGADELTVDFYIETSDFREVSGIKLPFKFQQLVTTPFLRQSTSGMITGTISEYRHNEPINPEMFR